MHYFSTDDIPERDRLAFFHEVVARHVAGRQFRCLGDEELRVSVAALNLSDDVMIGKSSYSAVCGTRTRELMNDGRDGYLIAIHHEEHEIAVDGRAPLRVPAGHMMIVNDAVWSQFHISGDVTVLALDRRRLSRLVPRIEREAGYHIPVGADGLALMAGYADLLHGTQPESEKARQAAAGHLYDLTALLLDGFFKGGTGWNRNGLRAARLELAKREIAARLANPELTIGMVARRLGITPRYIQRLFEGEGTSFSEYLRDRRLELAFSLLQTMPLRGGSISAVAFDAGFADLSSFNRAFRRRYGVTPSEVRAEAMRRR